MVKARKEVKIVELFYEKTGEVLRLIRFREQKEFKKFLEDFALMRYPGYGWRFKEKTKRKTNI